MDPPGFRGDLLRQGIHIGAFQFGQSPVFQYVPDDLMVLGQVGEHVFRGGILPRPGFLGFIHQL